MAATNDEQGYWLRSADGGLYFIPKDDLNAYRLPDAVAEPTIREIDSLEPPETVGFSSSAGARVLAQPGGAQRGADAAKPWIPTGDLTGLRPPGSA